MRIILITSFFFFYMKTYAQSNTTSFIEYDDAYSIYITKHLTESRDFYVKWLDFEVVFEASWFVFMQSKGEKKLSLAFIDETHPSSPPAYGTFNGRGSFLTLQVREVSLVYNKLRDRHAPITYHLKKEDWGQMRFGLTDPNGLYIDVVQQIEPVQGYWDKYMIQK